MDPADSDFPMEELNQVEYTFSRLNSELVKSTDLERRHAICSLMERTISSRPWLQKVPGMATLADQLSGLGKSLQSLLVPSCKPVFEAASLPPDPAPPAHCQGLRVGVLCLQPAASGPEPQPEEFQFPPELLQVPRAPSRRIRAKRWPTWSSDTMPPVPGPEAPSPVPAAHSPDATPAA
ncbi:vegetative cell wall protein gp1-like [Alosa sapidissima]|uniref:vegetative cell wall protein gp1-like n=1 Tax=Alosa sapidissima TaxID=34773 RepID=UPI001C088D9B|nr:vegetative cell wall protein gp1-like [Alosa sapidissima]